MGGGGKLRAVGKGLPSCPGRCPPLPRPCPAEPPPPPSEKSAVKPRPSRRRGGLSLSGGFLEPSLSSTAPAPLRRRAGAVEERAGRERRGEGPEWNRGGRFPGAVSAPFRQRGGGDEPPPGPAKGTRAEGRRGSGRALSSPLFLLGAVAGGGVPQPSGCGAPLTR